MVKDIKVSLFASAVRPQLWPALLKSLEDTSVGYEVIFAGNIVPINCGKALMKNIDSIGLGHWKYIDLYNFNYILTGNIKPAQCYEIARRYCTGEVVVWIADDCEFPNDVIGKAYNYWKSQNNEKLILSIQTKESGYGQKDGKLFNMNEHRFFSQENNSPLMAPLGMMSRKFLDELNGFDARYVCGQYENDCVCRAYEKGAKVEIFGGEDCYIDIDHLRKSIEIGESKDENSFRERPFAKGYGTDRQILENSWSYFDQEDAFKRLQNGERPSTLRRMSNKQLDKFVPYEDTDLLTKSQHNKGIWE